MIYKKVLIKLLFIIPLLFICSIANAQCDPFFDPFCEDVDVPLDDYAGWLVFAAALMGFWVIYRRNKPTSEVV